MPANDFRNVKLFSVTPPAAIIDNASATTAEIDTKGFRHLRVIAYVGAIDVAMSALKLTESDTTGNNHADITGTVFGTATGVDGTTSALPTADDDNKFYVIDVDLRGRKRFIDVVATCGNGDNGTYIAIWAELYQGEATPSSAALMGAGGALSI